MRAGFSVALAAVMTMMLSACGSSPAAIDRTINGSDSPARLLEAWARFPINASPRPIVLVGSPVLSPAGFRDNDAKLDFLNAAFDVRTALPSGPSSSDGYQVISAGSALDLLRSAGHRSVSTVPSGSPTSRLSITAVRFGSGTFQTDRGDRSLPAWEFSFAGVDGSASVLAVSATAQWSPPGFAFPSNGAGFVNGATLAPDHRGLTVGFTGAKSGTGPCTASYDVNLTESVTTVVVTVIEHSHSSSSTACTLEGYVRSATGSLSTPLGNRVVLDAVSGQPVAVAGA